ncbi:MAG TPA: 2-amino-4-hydroxy-6-hydroxymethyldihydropteridine diphosphokinase [Actinomycetales bacterium]|jgi:dihydroneopterin aldolase/2-amino-4-hydroxy-6-hydroxymethyldihydropteridine diphosphokinase
MSVPIVLALGSNLGDSAATLAEAVRAIDSVPGVRVRAVSPFLVTAPVGGPEQPDYLNAVVLAGTTLEPAALLAATRGIEAAHGRQRSVRWGARTLDIDLVAWGEPDAADEVVSDDPALTLPHPRAHERAFVLRPWLEVDPHARLRLPGGSVLGVGELLRELDDAAVPVHPR